MTYENAREFIDSSNQYGSKLGLEAITELLNRLDNPQDKIKIIHVAGTNGKGSTSAFIASILATKGYRVGRYISPAVFSYEERIQISSRQEAAETITTDFITEKGVSDTIEIIKPVCEAMLSESLAHPTSFEIETAMAFLYLEREKVDFAIIEVGLGGRLDATNAIRQPICSVITSISMDHMEYLGNTLGHIASEKAGIIKKNAPVITGNKNPEVLGVFEQSCKEFGTTLILSDADKAVDRIYSPEATKFKFMEQDYEIKLIGEHQISNAVLAIQTAYVLQGLGYPISDVTIKKGLLQTKWSGRFEIIANSPNFIVDGAHNEDAALQLRSTLLKYFPNRRMIFIMGVLADKDFRKILCITAPLAKVLITLTPNNSRALDSSLLAKEARQYTEAEVIDAKTVSRAVKYAHENIKGKDDIILAFGSLSYLGEISEYVRALV